MEKKYIAFDVGGTKVKHSVMFEDGTIIEKGQYNTLTSDLDQFLSEMVFTVEEYKYSHQVSGIGISMPGFIDITTGYSETAGNVAALKGKNIKSLLEERVDIPVEVENDGNCVALAELLNGNAIDSKNFICVTIGTGIGGGIVIDGKILHGHSFRGGEFGFMITERGNKGKEIWHHNGATSSLINDYKKLKGINIEENLEGHVIFEEAVHDGQVNHLIENWLNHVSSGIFNLAVTLNPEKILIGGGVSAQNELIERIEAKLEQLDFWKDFRVPITICKHRNDAGMLGAVKHFLNRHETS
ncbi:ROK family protein [Neobacillus novalis]|uniref:ROK family protein n=1 Tax=Neobacillus novalis TaxID=220687 RepID=A0AA95MPF9_9BACI|nr:ROK family protein [Neobacillus novalis]WHY85673.1 ROK family protein [Neobacillus novalis]